MPPPHQQQQQQHHLQGQTPSNASIDGFLQNPVLINQFKHHLNCLMQNFILPPDYNHYHAQGIDPVVLMMMSRAKEPTYANIDFNAMMFLYSMYIYFLFRY